MSQPVKTWSHNEVVQWVKNQVSKGTFKHCTHLTVIKLTQGDMTVFVPDCQRRSFDWKTPPLGRQFEFEILTSMLHLGEISCPKNCVNYASQRRASLFKPFSRFQVLIRYFAVPFQWFAKLPWQTQIVILVLGIVIAARPLIPLIVQLLNAYHGK
jgi:hypothetical protein